MKISIKTGDVLAEPAGVIIAIANLWLNLSGGVRGAMREVVGHEIQAKLHEFLEQGKRR